MKLEDRLEGETEYWGSVVHEVKLEGQTAVIVVAGSGFKSEIDEMICRNIANRIQYLMEVDLKFIREQGDDSPLEIVGPMAA